MVKGLVLSQNNMSQNNCGRARARPQTNLAFGGQRHVQR